MTLTIIVAIVAFLAVTLVLVGLLLYAKAKLTSSGDVTIDINDGEKVLTTESGSTLLVTLANNNVFLPSACGGGGSSKLWRQMLADLYGCQVKTTQNKEGPALGVALLAAVGAGIYKSVPEACRAVIKPEKIQEPIAENTAEYEKVYAMYRKLYPAMKQSFAELAQM